MISTPWKQNLLRIFNYSSISLFLYFYSSELLYISKTTDNLPVFLNNSGSLFTQTLAVIKWFILLYYRKDFLSIHAQLQIEQYQYEDCKDFKPGEKMFGCRKTSRTIVVLFTMCGFFVPIVKQLGFVGAYINRGHLVGTENVTCFNLLPYYNKIPFNIESPLQCISGFLSQSLPMLWIVGPIISCDLTFVASAIYARAHLLNIRNGFASMRERCLVRLGLPDDYSVLLDSEHPALEKEIHAESRKLSVHLQGIIGIIEKLENICKFAVLGQSLTTLYVLVTCLYIISVEPVFSPTFIAQVQYCFSMCVEFFGYCYLGTEVTSVSSDVSSGIYAADWMSCTKSVKSTLIINLMRLQKPIYFTIGNFSPLTLNTFVSIVKGAYSYFTFLDKT